MVLDNRSPLANAGPTRIPYRSPLVEVRPEKVTSNRARSESAMAINWLGKRRNTIGKRNAVAAYSRLKAVFGVKYGVQLSRNL